MNKADTKKYRNPGWLRSTGEMGGKRGLLSISRGGQEWKR